MSLKVVLVVVVVVVGTTSKSLKIGLVLLKKGSAYVQYSKLELASLKNINPTIDWLAFKVVFLCIQL